MQQIPAQRRQLPEQSFSKNVAYPSKEDFGYERTKQMAHKYLRKMQEGDPEGNTTVNEWEIIPYEILWERCLTG